MRVDILAHVPGRQLVVAVRAGPLSALAGAAGVLGAPALFALQAHAGVWPSPGLELPLLIGAGALLQRSLCAQQVLLQDGDALVQRGLRRWRLPRHHVKGAALLHGPARLALQVDLPDCAALQVERGWATVLETRWEHWCVCGPLAHTLEEALQRLGLSR